MTVSTAVRPGKRAAVAKAPVAETGAEEEPGRADLIAELEQEQAAFKAWLTLFYHSAIDYQERSHHRGGGHQVCIAGFNRWLTRAGFPHGITESVIPDRNAEIAVPGDDGILMEHLTMAGLEARREAWHKAWDEKRVIVRQAIIDGVGNAHGNFPDGERDKALELLGLDPVRRMAQVSINLGVTYRLDQQRVSDARIKEKVAEAIKQAIGDGEIIGGNDINHLIYVDHMIVDAA